MDQRSAILITVFLITFVVSSSFGQLTFTPQWGKRSGNPSSNSDFSNQSEMCKTSMDSMMFIYKMIQAEAQKYVECSQK
ncbi:Adipokinetic hormone [Pseudolycoriella hygida]|uniref:Adipokinetic hormone n=1 Tax=Pseudolycoriella hygida TaxID=35572 RepID=A0A9Q0S144_9DIPT|nr:Adipokinetic hormone [Pseudolycoriella hygida]